MVQVSLSQCPLMDVRQTSTVYSLPDIAPIIHTANKGGVHTADKGEIVHTADKGGTVDTADKGRIVHTVDKDELYKQLTKEEMSTQLRRDRQHG